MGEMWRKASELIWRRPVLWLPVLVAELLSYFVMLGRGAWIRHIILSRMRGHSVLGGPAVTTRLTGPAAVHANNIAITLTWTAYFIRLLLYAAALVVTSALVRSFLSSARKPTANIGAALQSRALAMLSLALRALAIYGGVALVVGWVGRWLVMHGHRSASVAQGVELTAGLLLDGILALVVAPVGVQALSGHLPGQPLRWRAQLFAFLLALVALALGTFVTANIRAVHFGSLATRILLEVTGSWIAALPYALLFVGLAVIALEQSRLQESSELPDETP